MEMIWDRDHLCWLKGTVPDPVLLGLKTYNLQIRIQQDFSMNPDPAFLERGFGS